MAALAHLFHLKKVCKKIHSKEYYFVEQSLCELETKETKMVKTGSIPIIVETTDILEVESPVSEAH